MTSNRRKLTIRIAKAANVCSAVMALSYLPAFADATKCHIRWDKLNLSPSQSQQIAQIETQWQHDFTEIKPTIIEEQQKLTKKLGEHCDQLEVISLQESIQRKQNQLRQIAMMTFLKKRSVLNESQQHNLEAMMNQEIISRQRERNPGSQQNIVPDGVQDLLQRVNGVFPVNSDR
jgi:hypothetical protein